MADALYSICWNRQGQGNIGSATNLAFDDSGDGLAFAFQPYTNDPITYLGIRYGARAGTPPSYIASLQGLTTGGLADGAIKGGGSPASVIFTPPADTSIDGTWIWKQLANAYTPSRGEFLAACWEYSSGTIDGSNNSSFTRLVGNFKANQGFPYALIKTAGTWAKSTMPAFGYRTASGRYGYVGTAGYTTTITTTGQRSAMNFTLPATHGSTFQIAGTSIVTTITAAQSLKFGLWDTAGTLLQSATIDQDHCIGGGGVVAEFFFTDATLATLSYGTKYYIGFESLSSSTVVVRGVQLTEAADRSAYPMGTNRGYSTWNGSTWTDDNTVMPLCELIFADVTAPSGAPPGLLLVYPQVILIE